MTRLLLRLSLLVAALAWCAFNWPTLVSLHRRWSAFGETYEIGYPLVGIALYWIFMRGPQLRAAPVRPSATGAALFLLALALACAGRLTQLLVLEQAMVPVSLWCGLYAILGWRVARWLLLPCALLMAGVPVWDFLVEPLRALTVSAVQALLRLAEIPALVQGYRVVLPAGVMVIEDACSGLNLLLAALVLSLLQASLNLRRAANKLLLVAIGAIIGIVDNWLRVFVLIVIAHYSNMKNPLVHDHVTFGWWMFVVSLVPFFYLARRIEHGEQASLRDAGLAGAAAIAPPAARAGASIGMALLATLSIGGALVAIDRIDGRDTGSTPGFAAPAAAWTVKDGWLPQYSGYDLAQTWRLVEGGATWDIAALTYVHQRHDRKLIHYANRIADAHDIKASEPLSVDGRVVLNEVVVREGGGYRIVWWQYRVGDVPATDPVSVKLLQFRALLSDDRSAALVAVSRICRDRECAFERRMAVDEDEIRRILQRMPTRPQG